MATPTDTESALPAGTRAALLDARRTAALARVRADRILDEAARRTRGTAAGIALSPTEEEALDAAIIEGSAARAEAARIEAATSAEQDDLSGSPAPLTRDELTVRAAMRYIRHGDARYEHRASQQSVAIDTQGGYLAGGPAVARAVYQQLDELRHMRRICTPLATVDPGQSLAAAWIANAGIESVWGPEFDPASPSDLRYSGREYRPHYLGARTYFSRSLLHAGPPERVDAVILRAIATRIGERAEQGYLAGTGVQQPLGVFTPSPDGVPLSRDVETGGSDDINYDDLVRTLYSLRPAYQERSTWIMHRTVAERVAMIKAAGTMHPILVPGATPQDYPTLLGRPVRQSEFAPQWAAGAYCAVLGDYSQYGLVDTDMLDIVRMDEQYAERNTVGIVARTMTDGAPMTGDAFSRLRVQA